MVAVTIQHNKPNTIYIFGFMTKQFSLNITPYITCLHDRLYATMYNIDDDGDDNDDNDDHDDDVSILVIIVMYE